MEHKKLSFKTKIFYGMGDIYGGGAFNIVNFFYAVFLTDIVKISPGYAALVFLISKIWDAVTDPFMGYISDNTKSKYGRRRPYYLYGIPLIFISFVLLWLPVGFSSELSRFLYILLAFMGFNTVVTMVMVPYQAMSAELTTDYNERTSLASFRLVFSLVASLLCAVIPLSLINAFGQSADDIKKGYIFMAVIFGLLFALPWIGTFKYTYENYHVETGEKDKHWFKNLLQPLKIKTFRIFLFLELFTFIAFDLIVLVFGYYMKYYRNQYGMLSIVLGILIIVEVAFVPVFSKIAKIKGKITAFVTGCVVWAFAGLIIFFIGPDTPIIVLLAAGALIGVGLSGAIVIPYTMFGDVVDVGVLKHDRNISGSFSGILTFSRKATTAIAQSIVLFSLGLVGYLKPVDQMVDGVLTSVEQVQPAIVILAIRLIITFVPIILLTGSIICAKKYPLTREVCKQVKDAIETRQDDEATRELKKMLL
ncbi:MAG: MFS transporter [Clostridia bacterium]|nr:MFS transporter [Clostridia bacterium]